MCGIVGVLVAKNADAVAAIYDALLALQHRGQDAAGIVTENGEGRLCLRKDNGQVRDVFSQEHMSRLTGEMGIGHIRYPTAGSSCSSEAQPFYVNSPFGITLAHNGNLVNAEALTAELAAEWRHINTGSDSEILLNIFAAALLETTCARNLRTSPNPMKEEKGKENGTDPVTSWRSTSPRVTGPTQEDIIAAARHCMSRCIGG